MSTAGDVSEKQGKSGQKTDERDVAPARRKSALGSETEKPDQPVWEPKSFHSPETKLQESRDSKPVPLQRDQRLACPFYKYDPKGSGLHRSCGRPGYTTVHRLK